MTYSTEWTDFYRGNGPMPQPVETVTDNSLELVTALGGGWFQVGDSKVQGLARALRLLEDSEEE